MKNYFADWINHIARYTKNLYYKLRGKRVMNLPTTLDGKIDAKQVTGVTLLTIGDTKFFVVIVAGNTSYLRFTTELHSWFVNSNIAVTDGPEPVDNIPELIISGQGLKGKIGSSRTTANEKPDKSQSNQNKL